MLMRLVPVLVVLLSTACGLAQQNSTDGPLNLSSAGPKTAVLDNDAAIVTDFVRETSQILSANYAYYEFLLIDNGSRDGTEAIVQDLLRSIPNLRLLCLSRSHSTEIWSVLP